MMGRPQFDDTGVACIFVHEAKKIFYKKFLHEPFPVESSLHEQLHEHINAEIASDLLHNVHDCIEYLTWTYFFRRLIMNPSYYNLIDNAAKNVEDYLTNMIVKVVSDLEKANCIEVSKENNQFCCTFLGKVASYYYLNYKSVGEFQRKMKDLDLALLSNNNNNNNNNINVNNNNNKINTKNNAAEATKQLLMILCEAHEFSELPVRHNEDLLNDELSKNVPWSLNNNNNSNSNNNNSNNNNNNNSNNSNINKSYALDSPHFKTFLLIQANVFKIALPIADYINDTKSVLDQFNRVLNAMIDIAAEDGLLQIVCCLISISQMIAQVFFFFFFKYYYFFFFNIFFYLIQILSIFLKIYIYFFYDNYNIF
jgi:replicative superfamily II helicase